MKISYEQGAECRVAQGQGAGGECRDAQPAVPKKATNKGADGNSEPDGSARKPQPAGALRGGGAVADIGLRGGKTSPHQPAESNRGGKGEKGTCESEKQVRGKTAQQAENQDAPPSMAVGK